MEGSRGFSDLERYMHSSGLQPQGTRMSLVLRTDPCRPYRLHGKADRERECMDTGTALQVPGCEGRHAATVSRCRPGELAWSQRASGNARGEGGAEIAGGQARPPRGA